MTVQIVYILGETTAGGQEGSDRTGIWQRHHSQVWERNKEAAAFGNKSLHREGNEVLANNERGTGRLRGGVLPGHNIETHLVHLFCHRTLTC